MSVSHNISCDTGENEDYCLLRIVGDSVQLVIYDDDLVEGNEVFTAMLVMNSNNTQAIIRNGVITVVIYDDDGELVPRHRLYIPHSMSQIPCSTPHVPYPVSYSYWHTTHQAGTIIKSYIPTGFMLKCWNARNVT